MNKFDDKAKATPVVRINNNIRCPNIKIVGKDSILTNKEAQELAVSSGLDLMEVNFIRTPDGKPVSICKLLDYGKYIYEKKKAEKLQAKKARECRVELKTVKFHITSDIADINRKCKNIIDFLNEGNNVSIEIYLRGREQSLTNMINDLMNNILDKVKEYGIMDSSPKYSGKSYSCVLRSKNTIKIK